LDKEIKELFTEINLELKDINSRLKHIELENSNGNYTYTDTNINYKIKK
jgi:hypothetical protein